MKTGLFLMLSPWLCFLGCAHQAQAEAYSASAASPVLDLATGDYLSIDWTSDVPAGTSLTVQVRAGGTPSPDAGWTSWTEVSDGENLAFLNGNKFLQYKTTLSSDGTAEPSLYDIAILFSGGYLLSSPYNAQDTTTVFNSLAWTESLPGSSDVKIQLRTSPDNVTWTPWCGPDDGVAGSCSSTTYFTDPDGTETIDDLLRDGSGDKYVQYRVLYTAVGSDVPSVSGINLLYSFDPTPTRAYAGVFTSQIFDLGQKDPLSLVWSQDTPIGTSLSMRLRAGTTRAYDADSWTAWAPAINGMDLSAYAGKEYFQYEVTLSSDGENEPSLAEVTFISRGGFLISSPYDSEDVTSVLDSLMWSESLPPGSDLKFQLRTSPDGTDWTPWCGPDDGVAGACDSDAYFTDPTGAETVDDLLTDGSGDQFVQYKVLLSGSSGFPSASGIDLHYSIDSAAVRGYSGVFTSSVLDLGQKSPLALTWNDSVPIGTSLSMRLRAGTTCAYDADSWTAWAPAINGMDLSAYAGKEYFQYEVTLSSDGENEPSLAEVTFSFEGGFLVSSPYDSQDATLVAESLSWTESVTATSDIRFQLRTSPDGTDWTPWCGPDNGGEGCDSTTYFTDPNGSEAIDPLLADKSGDRFIQYKLLLARASGDYPSASGVNLHYSIDRSYTRSYAGTYLSPVFEGGVAVDYTSISWTENIPVGTSLVVKVRAGSTSSYEDEYWSDWAVVANHSSMDAYDGIRYVQYEVDLSSDGANEPNLDDVTIGVNDFLISNPYNTENNALVLSKLTWTETPLDNAGLPVRLRISSSPDNVNWTPWCGPEDGVPGSCSSTTYFTDPNGTDVIDDVFMDGVGDQYIRYMISFDGSVAIPTVSDVDIQYVANTSPTVANVAADQDDLGLVNITYEVADNDETVVDVSFLADVGVTLNESLTATDQSAITVAGIDQLPASGVIQLDDEQIAYSAKLGNDLTISARGINNTRARVHASGAVVWIKGTTVVEDVAGVLEGDDVAISSTPQTKTGVWDIRQDLAVYYALARVRVNANDGNGAYQVANNDSISFELDTLPPVVNNITIDGRKAENNISLDVSDDDSAFRMKYSTNQADPANAAIPFGDYAAAATVLLDAHNAVHFRFIDKKSNFTDYTLSIPEKIVSPLLQDVTNLSTEEYRLFFSFHPIPAPAHTFAHYHIYAADAAAGAFTQIATQDSLSINYYMDAPLAEDQTRYYKAAASDQAGNFGEYSTVVSGTANGYEDVGEGNGLGTGGDTTPPVISNAAVTAVGEHGATFTFNTDENSDSAVRFSTGAAFDQEQGVPTYIQNAGDPHTVTLIGLEDNTKYYYQLVSTDAAGNTGLLADAPETPLESRTQYFITSTDTVAPTITDLSAAPADTSAVFTFKTSEAARVRLDYGPTAGYGQSVADEDLNIDHRLNLTGLSADTVYHYRISAIDASTLGNSSDTGDLTFATLTLPTITFDAAAGVTSLTANRATISFNTNINTSALVDYSASEGVFTSTQGSYRESATYHSVTLIGLEPETRYYFQLRVRDSGGREAIDDNASEETAPGYTFTTKASSDKQAPTISAVSLGEPTASSLTVSWTTDEPASSLVDFGPALDFNKTQGNAAELVTGHQVTLTGLAPATHYSLRVKSADENGNLRLDDNGGDGYGFTTAAAPAPEEGQAADETAPVIAFDPVNGVTNLMANRVTIVWGTDEAADSTVGYGLDTRFSQEQGAASLTRDHRVTLINLSPGTAYRFRLSSRDASGNVATDDNAGAGYQFTTPSGLDRLPPSISNVLSGACTGSTATITWDTDEGATSLVEYGTSADALNSTAGNLTEMLTEHSVTVAGLLPVTTYYFRVRSEDGARNMATDSGGAEPYAFVTLTASTTCPACSSGGGSSRDTTAPGITGAQHSAGLITWTTNEDGYSVVEYGETEDLRESVFEGNPQAFGKAHAVRLKGLTAGTRYYFIASSADQSGNLGKSQVLSFVAGGSGASDKETLKEEAEAKIKQLAASGLSEEEIKEVISGAGTALKITSQSPNLSEVTNSAARIEWSTDKRANSVIRFRVKGESAEREFGNFGELTLEHGVTLSNLESGVTYEYAVQSSDVLGNTSKSDWYAFTTSVIPSIYDVSVSDINLSSAVVQWKTNIPASDQLEYGTSIDYQHREEGEAGLKATTHLIKLNNLESGKTYHYRIKGVDLSGNILSSDDYTLTTFTLPQVVNYNIVSVREREALLSWVTNVETDATIRYTDQATGAVKSQGEDALATAHDFKLRSLEPGKDYLVQIQGRDAYGNQAVSQEFGLSTLADLQAPAFGRVNIENAVSSGKGNRVRTIISFTTDEPATTQVSYKQGAGTGDYGSATALDENLTTNHVVVITEFQPATVYAFRLMARDASGNLAQSRDFTVLVPEEEKSVIQMITANFESTFGWLKKLGG